MSIQNVYVVYSQELDRVCAAELEENEAQIRARIENDRFRGTKVEWEIIRLAFDTERLVR